MEYTFCKNPKCGVRLGTDRCGNWCMSCYIVRKKLWDMKSEENRKRKK